MPELQHSNTNAIPPELLLARTIAEYVLATRATIDNLRALRQIFRDPALEMCCHETRTSELDVCPCGELATVYNFASDVEFCARHHQEAEATR